MRGFTYGFVFSQNNRVRVELYVDLGDAAQNQHALKWLMLQREEIEREFGASLGWEPLEDKRACRVALYRDGSIDQPDALVDIRDWAIERLLQMRQIIGPRIRRYRSEVLPTVSVG